MSSPTAISAVEKDPKEHPRVETMENGNSPHKTNVIFASETNKKRTFADRLGLAGLIALVGGTIVILIVVALQAVLWQYGNSLDENNNLGSAIAHSKVTARFVTLSSMVVRIIVAVQAGVCTSLAAALLLEGGGVPLPDVLRFAAVRSLNGGPLAVLLPMRHQLSFYLRSAPAVVIVIIFITSSTIQLESTILLSDFEPTTIEGYLQSRDVLLANSQDDTLKNIARMTKIDYWGSRPSVYTPFGEIKEPGHTGGSNVHDSGSTYHGMIPFQGDDDREVRRFDGMTTIFATRVACAAPEIQATVQYANDSSLSGFLIGTASFSSSTGPLSCEDDPQGQAADQPSQCILPFNCTLPKVNPPQFGGFPFPNITEYTLSICAVKSAVPWKFDKTFFGAADTPEDNWTDTVLIINRNESTGGVIYDERPKLNVTKPLSVKGEWATFNLTVDGTVDLTMCFMKLAADSKYVEMRSNEATQQGTIDWDERNSKYDTSSVRKLLNSDGRNLTNQERGILDMRFPAFDKAAVPEHTVTDFRNAIQASLWPQPALEGVKMSIFTCLLCYGSRATTVNIHPFIASLFQDTLQQTGHPALALQAVFQSLSQMAYYEVLPSFSIKYPAKLQFPLTTPIPRHWIGFGVVTGITWMHLVLVGWMTIMFAHRTKHSIIGEVWQSVGQVVSGMSEQVLKQGVRSTDEEIRKSCKDTGVDRDVVGVSSARATGGLEVQERKMRR